MGEGKTLGHAKKACVQVKLAGEGPGSMYDMSLVPMSLVSYVMSWEQHGRHFSANKCNCRKPANTHAAP